MKWFDVLQNAYAPESDRLGVPLWPRFVKDALESDPPPPAPWIRMNQVQVDQLRSSLKDEQEQWFKGYAPAPPSARTMTPLSFRDRFTEDEEVAITHAASMFPQLRVWLDRLNAAVEISLDDPRTVMGLQTMAMVGLLSPERVIEILRTE